MVERKTSVKELDFHGCTVALRKRSGGFISNSSSMKKLLFLIVILFAACEAQPPAVCPCPCPDVPPPPATGVDAKHFFSTCCFPWTPVEKMGAFSSVRAYISADFISTEKGIFVEPIFKARTDPAGGLDSWVSALNEKGCTPILCINQMPEWMRGGRDADHPPVKQGLSRTDPASYADYARIFSELAKRYGNKKYPPEGLFVNSSPRWTNDPPNVKKSGLGYKVGFEVWNEPDKWWKKDEGSIYIEAEEYAALFAACYKAVKSVDATLQVYNGGFTGFDLPYMTRFVAALKALDCPMPDAFTVHHYSNVGNVLGKWPPTWFDGGACAPELDKDFLGIVPVLELAKANGCPVWVTEFGVDTRPPSWMYAKPFAGKSSEQLQSEWNLRTYLEYMRLGVARCMVFNGNDEVGAKNGGLYVSSGLLYGEGEAGNVFGPKPAYTSLVGAAGSLSGTTYSKDESTATERILRFDGPTKTVWAYWSPTASGRETMADIGGKYVSVTEHPQFTSKSK